MARTDTSGQLVGHALYHYLTCPFCLRVRFALWRVGLKVEKRDILIHPRHAEALQSGGGRQQVPCLRIENDSGEVRWLYESAEIVAYFRRLAA